MIKSLNRTGAYRTYSVADGLAGVRIEHIAEDSEGCLWFATWDSGVSRFDGNEFQNFTKRDGLGSNQTFFVQKDNQNRLWFGTANGVCWYDGAEFHHLLDDGITGLTMQCIYEDSDGRLWFGGGRTLGFYDGTAFHNMIPSYLQQYESSDPPEWGRCWGIAQDSQGHLWFGFKNLVRFDGTSFHRYNTKEGFRQDGTAYVVDTNHAGQVWIGRFENRDALWRYADGNFQSVQVDLGGQLCKIQCDHDGRTWFSTSEGILHQDGDGFSRFSLTEALPHPAVKAMFQDRDRQYWFATWCGVVLYDAHSISIFDLGKASSNHLRAVDRDLNYTEMMQARLSITSDPRIEALTDVINRRGSHRFIGHSAALRQFQVENKMTRNNVTLAHLSHMLIYSVFSSELRKGLAARVRRRRGMPFTTRGNFRTGKENQKDETEAFTDDNDARDRNGGRSPDHRM